MQRFWHPQGKAGSDMVDVAQLVRATDCGSVGRGFEPHLPPLPYSITSKTGENVFYILIRFPFFQILKISGDRLPSITTYLLS